MQKVIKPFLYLLVISLTAVSTFRCSKKSDDAAAAARGALSGTVNSGKF